MDGTNHTDRRQCTATAKGTGKQCKRSPIPGGTVCVKHGGGAPQVKKAARERLNDLVVPAIKGLRKSLKSKDDNTVTKTAQVILDRTGFHPSVKLEVDLVGLQEMLTEIVRVKPDLKEDIDEALVLIAEEKEGI